MGDRHVSMIINAPPERVFKLYTDPGRARDWLSGYGRSARPVRPISPAASSTLGPGTRWSRQAARTSPGSRRWPRSKLKTAGSDAGEVV
jgi:hypothetical protein